VAQNCKVKLPDHSSPLGSLLVLTTGNLNTANGINALSSDCRVTAKAN
jgi:hypothetical protein